LKPLIKEGFKTEFSKLETKLSGLEKIGMFRHEIEVRPAVGSKRVATESFEFVSVCSFHHVVAWPKWTEPTSCTDSKIRISIPNVGFIGWKQPST